VFLKEVTRQMGRQSAVASLLALVFSVGTLAYGQSIDKPLAVTAPFARSAFLSPLGTKLDRWGIHPEVNLVQFWLGNPSLGERPREQEALTLISVGGDFNMKTIARVGGATLHFEQLFVPATANNEFGNWVGDEIGGQPPPYIPQVFHLTKFTWEQHLGENKLDVEFGKANMGHYIAQTVCNQEFTCQSPLLQWESGAGVNPAPYANWMGRVVWNVTQNVHVQAAEWRSTAAFPFTNGWEFHKTATDSNVYGVNLYYRTPNPMAPNAKNYELLFTHNTATQHDVYTGGTEHGVNGLYLGGKQAFWIGQRRAAPIPASLSAFAATNIPFSEKNGAGLAGTATWGVQANGPFARRPFDSYSIKMTYMRETSDEQLYLKSQNLANGGTGDVAGRNELSIGPDANFILSRSVIASPYMLHTFHANTMMNPAFGGRAKDGWMGGVVMVFLLDKMTGLAR
jgi:porin